MHVASNQLKFQPKAIGQMGPNVVLESETKGGLFIVSAAGKNGQLQTLGVGPHRAVARYMAQKDHPAVKITELSKSEVLSKAEIEQMLPKAYELLAKIKEIESNG
jgi:hypothetical protein